MVVHLEGAVALDPLGGGAQVLVRPEVRLDVRGDEEVRHDGVVAEVAQALEERARRVHLVRVRGRVRVRVRVRGRVRVRVGVGVGVGVGVRVRVRVRVRIRTRVRLRVRVRLWG